MTPAAANPSTRHRLSVDVPGLASLGAEGVGVLFGDGPPPCDADRVESVGGGPGWTAHRYPLPGTPHADGRFREPPKGAGTGWVRWWRFGPGGLPEWKACLRARFTSPVSQGRATRLWNLLCRLQGEGVPVPAPLAVGERGRGIVARHGFLILRELVGHRPLGVFLRDEGNPDARRRVAEALGRTLSALFQGGLRGAEFGAGDFQVRDVPADSCGSPAPGDGIGDADREEAGGGCGTPTLAELPGVDAGLVLRSRARAVLANPIALESARFGKAPGPVERVAMLRTWSGAMAAQGVLIEPKFALRVARRALGPGIPKATRMELLAGPA